MSTVQAHGAAVAAAPGGGEQVGDREAQARPRATTDRLAGLDGLRALAIVAVLVFTTLAFTQRADAPKTTPAAPPMASSATEAPKTATSHSDFRRLFIDVAKVVRPSVVAVTSVSTIDTRAEEGNPFEFFFRGPQGGRSGKQTC